MTPTGKTIAERLRETAVYWGDRKYMGGPSLHSSYQCGLTEHACKDAASHIEALEAREKEMRDQNCDLRTLLARLRNRASDFVELYGRSEHKGESWGDGESVERRWKELCTAIDESTAIFGKASP